MSNTPPPNAEIAKIHDVLRIARSLEVKEITAEVPFWFNSHFHGVIKVKAKWAE